MLLGRGEFMRLAAMATPITAHDPSTLASVTGDRYWNPRLGVSIVKPTGWRILSVEDSQAATRHQRFATDDPEVVAILRGGADLQFLVITKFEAEHPTVNPCITCRDEALEPFLEDALDCHQFLHEAWPLVLRGVTVQAAPAWIDLPCGTLATRSVWSFDLEQDARPTEVMQVRTILVSRGDRIHSFHFMDGLFGEAAAGDELEAAARSLSYR